MNDDLELTTLPEHNTESLCSLWSRLGPRRVPPRLKRILIRELAWHIQARRDGDLDAQTRRLLRSAVRSALVDRSESTSRARKEQSRGAQAALTPGATLVRTWRGRTHEVRVVGDGKRFEYKGTTYESLTQIAEVITGAHWSGPRFFGLDKLRDSA